MAEEDRAILVGISRYRSPGEFPPLDGPLNDVRRMREWLIDHQRFETHQISELVTAQGLLQETPPDGWPPGTEWAPTREDFSKVFERIAMPDGRPIRRDGRLYLYFSGHGFSLDDDEHPSAALFSADSIGSSRRNLAGTVYALAVKRGRLFREVVLIMDCCRDVEFHFTYDGPGISSLEASGAEATKLFALYAAPKKGRSQERELPNSEGEVVGLMTDAFLRALRETPPDVTGQIAGKLLHSVVEFNWDEWYPFRPAPPAPRGVYPDAGDLYFRSPRKDLQVVTVTTRWPLDAGTTVLLRSPDWNAVGVPRSSSMRWREKAGAWWHEIAVAPASDGAAQFQLTLAPGPHTITVAGQVLQFDPGTDRAITV